MNSTGLPVETGAVAVARQRAPVALVVAADPGGPGRGLSQDVLQPDFVMLLVGCLKTGAATS